jgi:predicted permease
VVGLGFASFGIRTLVVFAQTTDTRGQAMAIDGGVLAFAVGAAVLTAVLAGLPPALVTFRLSVADASRADSRSVAGSRTRHRFLRGLVVAQVAVAFALANIAALFSASYLKVLRANRDLATEYVLSGELALHGDKYDTTEKRIRFNDQLVERISAIPGVSAAATTTKLPLEGGSNSNILVNDEVFDPKVTGTTAEVSAITPGYFAAQGLRLLKGRTLEAADAGADNFGVVVNRVLAEKCWPGKDPIGQVIRTNSLKTYFHAHVVGVVESVRQWGPKTDPIPEMYWTLDHAWGQTIYLIVRSPQPAAQLTPLLRRAVAAMDADLPLARVRTLGDVVRESTQGDRALAGIIDFFMATALGLVAVGLYGTLSYQVLQRTKEIGIRMAIGAERGSIHRLVFRQGFAWVVIGLGLGAVGSLCMAAALRSMIWGVDPVNFLALAGSAAVVAAAAALASWVPAWRAARVDPIVALRFD